MLSCDFSSRDTASRGAIPADRVSDIRSGGDRSLEPWTANDRVSRAFSQRIAGTIAVLPGFATPVEEISNVCSHDGGLCSCICPVLHRYIHGRTRIQTFC